MSVLFPEVLQQEEGKAKIPAFPEIADNIPGTPFTADPNMVNVYFVRHTNTDLDNKGSTHGWIDEPLSEQGQNQAQNIAQLFANSSLDKLYTSDLTRARQTASYISAVTGTQMEPTESLRPLNMGILSGLPHEKAHKIMEPLIEHWKKDQFMPIPGGESYADMQSRNLGFFQNVLGQAQQGQTIGIVGHSMTERMLDAYAKHGLKEPLQGKETEEINKPNDPPQYAVYHFNPMNQKLNKVEIRK